jgi:hypothetical protein
MDCMYSEKIISLIFWQNAQNMYLEDNKKGKYVFLDGGK